MSAYLLSWLSYANPESSNHIPATPNILASSPKNDSEDDDNETIKGDDADAHDDAPPAFPSIDSAQRLNASSTASDPPSIPRILSDTERMPPPPMPSLASRTPGVVRPSSSSPSAVSPSKTFLSVPPSTSKPLAKLSKKVEIGRAHV